MSPQRAQNFQNCFGILSRFCHGRVEDIFSLQKSPWAAYPTGSAGLPYIVYIWLYICWIQNSVK